MRIGFLGTRKNPAKIKKLFAFAVVAKGEGYNFFYFTPGRVDLKNRTIEGLFYQDGQWVSQTTPFPDVIYNDSYPSSEAGEHIVETLRESIPFTAHSIGDKMTVYERLRDGKVFDKYLIPSLECTQPKEVLDFVKQNGHCVFKPVWGHQGNGVVEIKRQLGSWMVKDLEMTNLYTKEEMVNFLQERLAEIPHIIQKFIVTRTQSGQAYDFRIHVQKNGDGRWVNTCLYPRIAPPGSFIANLSGGGYTTITKFFCETEYGENAYDMQRTLEKFGVQLARHMDEIYQESFDELGIDIGVDVDKSIWIYEINWKPGVPPIFYLELDVARNSLRYAAYLAGLK
ncbi:YheC/YheD family protein [Tumebacillus sp. ITR2]|uniref:YheC/YheD family protein n=1 Tax=Tumebacillus amylolyticus TaxID=2801339 RepID=A0ABS1JC33_9BACL|nr:YheC/YheD family protein [Tumebacillus amylolyticus]MBL0387834.1 YheC/YheD family protein [Tumebacillus amylolyticus]